MDLTKKDIENVFITLDKSDLKKLSRKELEDLFLGEQNLRVQAFKELEKKYSVEGKYIILKRRFYMPSSEKAAKKPKVPPKTKKKSKGKSPKKLLPSERYPNAEIIDLDVVLEDKSCDCCGNQMCETGMVDISEVLTVIPKKYVIERHHHEKLKCLSCETMVTAPRVPRIKPGSSYSDDLIIDATLSKFCDLIPMQRYAAMASREGLMGLPPNSLIELTHYLAFFVEPIVQKIMKEVLAEKVLHADETTHNMMEQAVRKQWYLWGFSTVKGAYFECHPSRSGDIAAKFLEKSDCHFLVTDKYAGYGKAVRLANRERAQKILEALCNAHARRKFKEHPEDQNSKLFIDCYRKIYHLEKVWNERTEELDKQKTRIWQDRYFRVMRRAAERLLADYPKTHGFARALSYFLDNYEGLSLFLKHTDIPIDNNSQERLLRSPVVGRKTWYGTHSLQGAQTTAAMFTIVESCKLVKINPRVYLRTMVEWIHQDRSILTPFEAKRDFPQIFCQDPLPQKTEQTPPDST